MILSNVTILIVYILSYTFFGFNSVCPKNLLECQQWNAFPKLETPVRMMGNAGKKTKESKQWLGDMVAPDLSSLTFFFNFPRNPRRAQLGCLGNSGLHNLTTCHPVTYGRPP